MISSFGTPEANAGIIRHLNDSGKARILYVNPSLRPEARVRYFPIGPGFVISALVRAGFSVDLADMDVRPVSPAEVAEAAGQGQYDLVFLGSIVTGYKIVKELAASLRERLPRAVICAGNSVASSIPEHLLRHTEVDAAVLGEGDITAVELARAVTSGGSLADVAGIVFKGPDGLHVTAKRLPIRDISSLPMIDYGLFETDAYLRAARHAVPEPFPRPLEQIRAFPVNTARGCVANCTFCYHVFKGQTYRHRSEESIVAEAEWLVRHHGVNYLFFHDDLSLFSKERARGLAEAIIASGLAVSWLGTCRAGLFDSRQDLPLLRLLARSGCVGLGYSLENADPGILKAMNKNITPNDFIIQADLLGQAGITSYTSLVFGYPQETEDTVARTFDICLRAGVVPSVGYLLPLPGSAVYRQCLENGAIADEEEYLLRLGDRQDLRINLTAMDDETFRSCVEGHVARLDAALGLHACLDAPLKKEHYQTMRTMPASAHPAAEAWPANRQES